MSKCVGCGVELQNTSKFRDGYVEDLSYVMCERCFIIKNYGQNKVVRKSNVDYMKIIDGIGENDKVVYVSMNDWNDASPDIDQNLFMSDQIHLNRRGYEKLDSCIAIAIAKDLENSSNPSFVY
jgi:hypothetical protein